MTKKNFEIYIKFTPIIFSFNSWLSLPDRFLVQFSKYGVIDGGCGWKKEINFQGKLNSGFIKFHIKLEYVETEPLFFHFPTVLSEQFIFYHLERLENRILDNFQTNFTKVVLPLKYSLNNQSPSIFIAKNISFSLVDYIYVFLCISFQMLQIFQHYLSVVKCLFFIVWE